MEFASFSGNVAVDVVHEAGELRIIAGREKKVHVIGGGDEEKDFDVVKGESPAYDT